jgi:hypothetical protein
VVAPGLTGFALNAGGKSATDSIMLRVGFDHLSTDNFVIGINGIEWRFHRAIRRLENDRTFPVPLNVFKNMVWRSLQPILRATRFSHFRLLEVHKLFNDRASSKSLASIVWFSNSTQAGSTTQKLPQRLPIWR